MTRISFLFLMCFFSLSCVEGKLSVEKIAIKQNYATVGQIRAAITEHYSTNYSILACFAGSPLVSATVLSGSQTLTQLQNWGYDTSTQPLSDYFDPLYYDQAKSVKVVVSGTEQNIEIIYIPDLVEDVTQGVFFDKERPLPSHGETCVSCEYQQGQRPSPCTCTRKTRTVCGANPSVACTEECTHCPTNSSYFDVAQALCDLSNPGPFGESTPFSDLVANDSILP